MPWLMKMSYFKVSWRYIIINQGKRLTKSASGLLFYLRQNLLSSRKATTAKALSDCSSCGGMIFSWLIKNEVILLRLCSEMIKYFDKRWRVPGEDGICPLTRFINIYLARWSDEREVYTSPRAKSKLHDDMISRWWWFIFIEILIGAFIESYALYFTMIYDNKCRNNIKATYA